MAEQTPAGPKPSASRRAVLAAGAGAVGALAGCEVYGDESAAPPPAQPAGGSGESGGGTVVATTDQVAVGGGLLVGEHGIVITQPTEGEFRAFSATCTHQGCTITEISDGTINCNCHGSRFSIEDGSVVQAAAGLSPDQQDPLPEAGITVDGDQIQLP
ncbi:MAG TPA: Rieske (2Fe-2S) protein [Natronosporangium sp.]